MASRQQEFTATEIKAGVLVLASLVILVVFLVTLGGWHPADRTAHHYMADFSNVAGLDVGADVRFGGLKAGRVVAIGTDPGDRSQIRVTVEVRGDVPVNEGSVASIEQVSLTADKHVEISTGSADAPLLADGATLKSRAAGGGLLDIPGVEGVMARLGTLLDRLNGLVGPPPGNGGPSGTVNLTTLVASLKTTLDEGTGTAHRVNAVIDENREGLQRVISRMAALEAKGDELVEQLQKTLSEDGPALHRSLANLQTLTGELNARAVQLGEAVKTFQGLGANGVDLLEQQRPAIEEILLNLRVVTRNLAELSRILADKPNALIVGARPAGEPKGERP